MGSSIPNLRLRAPRGYFKMSSHAAENTASNMNISEASYPSSYGVSLSGEPMDSSTPLGRRIASLPLQRRIDFRLNQAGQPMLKDIKEGTRNIASWAQTRGLQATHGCNYCVSGKGPFSTCVVLKSENGHPFFDGSCASCQFNRGASRCSFRVSPSSSYPAQLLKEFQSVRPTPEAQKHPQDVQLTKAHHPVCFEPLADKKCRVNSFSSPARDQYRLFTVQPVQPKPSSIQTDTSSAPSAVGSAPHGPAKSRADGTVLSCPLTIAMYNDADLLRQAVRDLESFVSLGNARLRKLEQSSEYAIDFWGAMSEMEKQSSSKTTQRNGT